MAVPIMFVFIDKILNTYKEEKKELPKLLGMFVLFGIISLSIGLWHPIRNKILFNQPLGGVLLPSQVFYIGNNSFFNRFIKISFKELFTAYCTIPGDFNIPAFIIKTSLFGEWKWAYSIVLVNLLKIINIVIICISFIAIGWKILFDKKNENRILDLILLTTWVINIVSYIAFNVQYPYTCTMDFRYLVPTVFAGIYFIASWLDSFEENKRNNYISGSVFCIVLLFCVLLIKCGL